MQKIPFKVSARTAKLIGEQNFSNPEGAIIELVKNCYDADAKNCLIIFDIVYDGIPNIITKNDFINLPKNIKDLSPYTVLQDSDYHLNEALNIEDQKTLREFFFESNSIYIIDNGTGMDADTIENHWMEIGTGNKEIDYITPEGRIKTGAKGIGRFALDRLGYQSEMWTKPKKSQGGNGYYWKMNWRQFDVPNRSLSEVTSDLEPIKLNFKSLLISTFKNNGKISKFVETTEFSNGTLIKISQLKDFWYKNNLASVYRNLEALVPPKELQIPFSVNFYTLQNSEDYGKVETAYFSDYDTKVIAKFDSTTSNVNITFERNELDLKKVSSEFSHLFKGKTFPLDLETLQKKTFRIDKSAFELLKWEEDTDNLKIINKIGSFKFTFYFLKNLISQKEGYPYKNINAKERRSIIEKFGGIKIYRDSFRVRPYGDPDNDWLRLSDRAGSSTAGAGQRIGDWKIGANQIAGLITISRINNFDLIDKSDRGSLIENESFEVLQNLIKAIISEFELDRTKILNPFYKERKQKELEKHNENIRREAEKIAIQIIEERTRIEKDVLGSSPTLFSDKKNEEERKSYQKIIELSLETNKNTEEKETEISQIRTLASLGLIVTSFSHELQTIKNNANQIINLERIYGQLQPIDVSDKFSYSDGLDIIQLLKKDTELMKHWIEYALTAVKKNKRNRSILKLEDYIPGLLSTWKKVLTDRNIEVNFQNNINDIYDFRAFEIDMNTIFSNLISNSIDSFNSMRTLHDRKISFQLDLVENILIITYSDNGAGLPSFFKNDKEAIFLPFTTSKKDRLGNDIGTGLGMYLVKNTVTDNNGSIDIIDSEIGFKIKIEFETRNK